MYWNTPQVTGCCFFSWAHRLSLKGRNQGDSACSLHYHTWAIGYASFKSMSAPRESRAPSTPAPTWGCMVAPIRRNPRPTGAPDAEMLIAREAIDSCTLPY